MPETHKPSPLTLSRRAFLQLSAAGAIAACTGCSGREPRIGLALGGGGAKGLAHILMLETLDELGDRPWHMARMESRWWLWKATQDQAHLAESWRLLKHLCAHAPKEYRETVQGGPKG